ncbi:MAG: ABC transporter permease [Spirochaetales bacterium]|nr:ABC transporter permease [Spirochaetales bacterium]
MILKLALRNLYRHPRQTFTVGAVVAVGIALLFIGNSLLDGTEAGVQESFINSFTGHLSLRVRSDLEFSIFGDQTPVIGELFKMPTLAPYLELRKEVEAMPGVASVSSIVSGLALLEMKNYRMPAPLFGVEPDTYLSTFPGIQIVQGRFLQNGERGVLLTEARVRNIEHAMNGKLSLGTPVQFSVTDGITFRIRSAPLVGIIRYPLRNETLDSLVLVDPTTVRELYSYMIQDAEDTLPSAAGTEASLPQDITQDSIDSLFAAPAPDTTASGEGIDRKAVEEDLAVALHAPRPATDEGAWNFILLRLENPREARRVQAELQRKVEDRGWEVEVLDWRRTAGSSALYLYWMRVIFNIGFLVVAAASLIVLIDTLIMAVLERTPEIGTLRALGATGGLIRKMFLAETTLLTATAGLLGIGIGAAVSYYLRMFPFQLTNPFLIQLFGGTDLLPKISMERLIFSWVLAICMGLIGWMYPVRIALRIQPRQAMERRV